MKITNVKTLKDRLIYARELRGMTQGELAAKAKCAQSAIGNAESGERQTLRNVVAVARALQVSADWLYDGYGPKPTKTLDTSSGYGNSQVVNIFAAESSKNSDLQPNDPYTQAAIEIMKNLQVHQREGALAALRTHVSHLDPPRIGQAL